MKREETISINDELIGRYLVGEATPDEAIALHEWLEKAENLHYFQGFELAWRKTKPAQKPLKIETQNDWIALKQNMRPVSATSAGIVSLQTWVLRIAAVLLLGLGISFYFYINRKPETVSVAAREKIEKIVLEDSTVAVLNKQAVISYPKQFGKLREVKLAKGEAFFKVSHNGKPFVVHTDVADIHVIGTAFNVTMSDGKLNVTVEEGRVLVTTSHDSSYLDPGYSGSVVSDTTPIKVAPSENKNIASYATRKFVFKDTPLMEVLAVMEKAYPYSFNLTNQDVGGCKLTASFGDVSAEYMLHLIAESLNLTVSKNDKGFIIEGKGCP